MYNVDSIVFPGQGSQRPGMGKDFYENYAVSKEVFDSVSEAVGFDMAELCFEENDRLDLTEYTQPAILTCEIAIYEALRQEHGLTAKFFAGHSLGEYSALVAAGLMPVTTAAKIVHTRGKLMQQAVPIGKGAMAAIIGENLNEKLIADILKETGAEAANYNSPNQVVISGGKEEVEAAMAQFSEEKHELRVVALNVSAPFHSSLMQSIETEFESVLNDARNEFDLAKSGQVISNFTGTFHTEDALITNLVRQISGSVLWLMNMKTILAESETILELGPNKILTGFFKALPEASDIELKNVIHLRSLKKLVGAA